MKRSLKNKLYSSHLPILNLIFNKFVIKNILEFGVGNFSTVFFRKKGFDKLFSIETSKRWAERFIDDKPDNHFIISYEKKDLYMVNIIEKFDLCFVDGSPAESRIGCINNNILKSNMLVLHDTESPKVKLNEIILPEGYTIFNYIKALPNTSLIIKDEFIDKEIIDFFK